jgi:hypothetical protein
MLQTWMRRIVETYDAACRIEDYGGGYDGTKQCAAPYFIDSGDAGPAKFSCGAFEAGGAGSCHE